MMAATKLPFLFLLLLLVHANIAEKNAPVGVSEDAISIGIGIGIGGGGESPEPAPPEGCGCAPSPPPPPGPGDFQDIRLYVAYKVIQRFRQTITCDPTGVTDTWQGTAICSSEFYKGFYCDKPPDDPTATALASVDFNGFRLCAPTVAGFLDGLPDVALFHANSNNFSGTVPDVSKLKYLYELDVSNNRLAGNFPSNALSLPRDQLLFLDLRFNLFSGSVPATVFSLNLDVLFLNNNGFSQPLPATLGTTTAAYLTLANNGFTGPIPRSIGDASETLIEILLLNNRLSGCLPPEIGKLKRATVFDAGGNGLTGPIPYSFGCLSRVEQLNLAGNYLCGYVPEGLCSVASLRNLSLSDNYITGVGGVACWKLLKRGLLDLRGNCVPGLPEQRSPGECAHFVFSHGICPYLPSTFYVPCKSSCNSNTTAIHDTTHGVVGGEKKVVAAPSPGYTALHRHRRP